LLRKLFKIRICNRLPKKACLQYFIKNCEAPCIEKVAQHRYMANVVSLQEILAGKRSIDTFANEMQDEMLRASKTGEYERAKEIRDTLYRLNNLRVRQNMERVANKNPDEEYIGIASDRAKEVAHVMSFRRTRGVISDRKKFEFDLVGDNSLSTFLVQYYSSVPVVPRFVYVNEALEDRQVLEMSIEKIAGHKVSIITIPEKSLGQKHELMNLIKRNLALYLERGYDPALIDLKNALKLDAVPFVIDCFDVSNLGVDIFVGACCRFVDARPDKSAYRKFKIKSIVGQDDFAMIYELVQRKYSHKTDRLPDLIVIDGGKGQLAAALAALRKIGLSDMPCISLAKENEAIFSRYKSEPLMLPRSHGGLKVLQRIRDEAHRFGLAYNVTLRRLS
jgi:excinuclease ABC subunit C